MLKSKNGRPCDCGSGRKFGTCCGKQPAKPAKPQKQVIRTQAIYEAEPLMCSANVHKRINALGGRAVYGWKVTQHHLVENWENHCVWESPEGELVDVTPVFTSVDGDLATVEFLESTEFIRDDAASFTDKANPGRYVAKKDNANLRQACSYMTLADKCLYKSDLEACEEWTERANELVKGLGIFWDCPASLDLADVLATR